MRATRHKAHRGGVEALSHDCKNQNRVFHALKNPSVFSGGECSGGCQTTRKWAKGRYSRVLYSVVVAPSMLDSQPGEKPSALSFTGSGHSRPSQY